MARWLILLALVGVLSATLGFAAGKPITPTVNKPAVLLDFYARWCGYCQRMAPVVKRLHRQAGAQRLTVRHVDVDNPSDSALVSQYQVNAVPTYYLFDASQRLTFVMNGLISEEALAIAIRQATGQLPDVTPPAALASLDKTALHWLVFQPTAQQQQLIREMSPALDTMVRAHSLPLNTAGITWIKGLHRAPVPGTAILLDRQGRLLHQAGPQVSTDTLRRVIGGLAMGLQP